MEKINILRVVNVFLAYLIFLFYLGDILVRSSVFNTVFYGLLSKIFFTTGLVLVPILLLILTAVFSKSLWINIIMFILGFFLALANLMILTAQVGYID